MHHKYDAMICFVEEVFFFIRSLFMSFMYIQVYVYMHVCIFQLL